MAYKNKQKCIICFYAMVLSLIAVASTMVLPHFDRVIIREVAGTLTFFGSLFGVGMCLFFVLIMRHGSRKLNARLQEVYFLMLVIFLCTAGFGFLGLLHPPVETWDVIYNIRAVAVVLEVFALQRFLKCWIEAGHSE